MKEFLRSVCPEFKFPGIQQLNSKNEEHADAGRGDHFNDKIEEAAEIQPLEHDHIPMMKDGKYKNINGIGCPAHGLGGRFPVGKSCDVLWAKNMNNKWPHIGDQYTGCGMQAGCHHEIVEGEPGKETNDQQPHPRDRERKPQYEQVIYIWSNETVQVRYFIQHIYLHQQEEGKTDYIFQQFAQLMIFLPSSTFFRVSSNNLLCSSNCRFSITCTRCRL